MHTRPLLLLAAVTAALSLGGCRVFLFNYNPPYQHLEHAEELSRQGDYDGAIGEYRKHMQYRLGVLQRPDWENPYFYLILISDIQLGQGKTADALATIELAEQNKVDHYLVSDRYRAVASWYEKNGKLQEAAELLTKYRDRDPELFDSMLDRVNKQIVLAEDAAH